MANWDHLSNIGTHPVLSTDPQVRLPHVIAAAEREIAKYTAIRDEAVAALTAATDTGLEPGLYFVNPIGVVRQSVMDEATVASRVSEYSPTNYFFVED